MPAHTRPKTLDQLTSVRGLAAMVIVFYHAHYYVAPYLPAPLNSFIRHGNLAVDMFFVLSGFVLYLNYAGRVSTSWPDMASFMKKRIARVYPLHILMLGCFLAFGLAVALKHGDWPAFMPLDYFLLSLFLLQNVGFTDILAWNVPAWSISTELIAYILFPFFLAVFRMADRRTGTLFAIIAAATSLLYVFFWVTGWPFPDDIQRNGLMRCLTQFVIGMATCELYVRGTVDQRSGAVAGLVAALCLSLLVYDTQSPVVPILWCSLIMALTQWTRLNPLLWRPLVYLGDISYAIYLSHYFLLIVFKYLFVTEDRTTSIPALALYLATVFAVSIVLYHFWERPAQKIILGRRNRPAKPLPAP